MGESMSQALSVGAWQCMEREVMLSEVWSKSLLGPSMVRAIRLFWRLP